MLEAQASSSERWRAAVLSASRKRQCLSARVVLEAHRLTVLLSDGRAYTAPRTVSAEAAIAAAIQWSRRHGATAVTVVR